MRSSAILFALAACGGNPVKPDAAPPDVAPPDVPIDADTSVTGTWVDTYYAASGPVMKPACAGPLALVVDPSTGGIQSYTGACHPDGSFRIPTPAGVTDYYLRAAGGLYATTAHGGLTVGTDHLGRPDATTVSGVELSLDLTGMETWANGDVLMAWGQNIGFYQSVVFDTGMPNAGDTTVVATAPWYGDAIDAAKSDTLQIYQLGKHTTSASLSYVTLDRAYTVAPVTMATDATIHIPATGSDAFTTPTASSMHISIDVPSWDSFAASATPNTGSRSIAANIYAAVSPDVIPSPPLFSSSQDSSSLGTIDFGTVGFSDPFPASWQRRIRVYESFATTYNFNFASGTLNAVIQENVPLTAAEQGTIVATVGPPASVTFDGSDALTSTFINQAPVVAWTAPALGTPTDYEITVYEAHINGTTLTFTQTLRMETKATSVRIPSGYLLGQRQYVFRVTSNSRLGADISMAPQQQGSRLISADMLSALVTTNF